MKKLLTGAGALLLLTGILVGIPAALVALAGNPFPTAEQWHAIVTLTPDYGNVIMFTKILPLVIWVLWAAFAIPFLVELVAAMGGRKTTKKVAAFRGQQKLAAGLIAAVAVMFAGGAGALSAPAPAAADSYAVGTVDASASPLDLSSAMAMVQAAHTPPAAPEQQQVVHQVVDGDTLWDLAVQYYGQGERFVEIFNANLGVQPDGQSLTDPDLILPGWQLSIPGVYTQAPVDEAPAPTTPAPSRCRLPRRMHLSWTVQREALAAVPAEALAPVKPRTCAAWVNPSTARWLNKPPPSTTRQRQPTRPTSRSR